MLTKSIELGIGLLLYAIVIAMVVSALWRRGGAAVWSAIVTAAREVKTWWNRR